MKCFYLPTADDAFFPRGPFRSARLLHQRVTFGGEGWALRRRAAVVVGPGVGPLPGGCTVRRRSLLVSYSYPSDLCRVFVFITRPLKPPPRARAASGFYPQEFPFLLLDILSFFTLEMAVKRGFFLFSSPASANVERHATGPPGL